MQYFKFALLKFFCAPLLFCLLPILSQAQTVGGISAEQVGEHVVITYHIYDSNPDQLFKVSIYCSINEMPDTLLTNVSGDVGDIVPGGKSEYQALWNVLKDVKNLSSADFLIKASLQKKTPHIPSSRFFITPSTNGNEGNLLYALFSGNFQVNADNNKILGTQIGYMGNWGILTSFSWKNGLIHNTDADDYIWNDQEKDPFFLYVSSLDVTKRVASADFAQLHLFMGPALLTSKFSLDNTRTVYNSSAGIDMGIITNISMISLSLGYTFAPNLFFNETKTVNNGWLRLGIGTRFDFDRKKPR